MKSVSRLVPEVVLRNVTSVEVHNTFKHTVLQKTRGRNKGMLRRIYKGRGRGQSQRGRGTGTRLNEAKNTADQQIVLYAANVCREIRGTGFRSQ